MTMRGNEARAVLVRQIDQNLAELKAAPGTEGCPAHAAITRSQATLLECQRATLTGETEPVTTKTHAIAIGGGSAAGGLVVFLLEVAQHFGWLTIGK